MLKRILISLLILVANLVLGQNLQQGACYRLYGTNLYSFAAIASSPYRENYTVAGTVKSKNDEVTVIEKDLGAFAVFNADRDALNAEPGELLKMLYVKERIEKSGGKISAGEFFSMDAASRKYVTFTNKTQIYVLKNCPDRVQVGQMISCFALPVANPSNNPTLFDYGRPFVENLDEYPNYFEIRPTSIVKVHRPSGDEVQAKQVKKPN